MLCVLYNHYRILRIITNIHIYHINDIYTHIGDINLIVSERMREEMMVGYCAAITFVDKQVRYI